MTMFRLEAASNILPSIRMIPEYLRERDVLPREGDDPYGGYPILKVVDGTWRTTSHTEPNKVIDTVTLFSNSSRDTIRFAVSALNAMLRLAKSAQKGTDGYGEVSLVTTTDDEVDTRSSIVYEGEIKETDSVLYPRNLGGGSVRLVLVLTREKDWDISTRVNHIWPKFPVHGGYEVLPLQNPVVEDVDGRIARLSVATTGGFIRRIWMGIKSARRDLTSFNPRIKVDVDSVNLQSGGGCTTIVNSDYHGGKGIRCSFEENSGWWPRFYSPLFNWNDEAASLETGGSPYIGEYYLLAKIRTPSSTGVYGVRATARWWGTDQAIFTSPKYIRAADTKDAFPYYNLGKINIGGLRWTPAMDAKMHPRWFVTGVHAASLSGDGEPIYFDDFFLMPAKRSINMWLPHELTGETQMQLFSNSDGSTRAFVIQRDDNDKLTGGDAKRMHAEVTSMSVENWTVPTEGGILVMVCDRGLDRTKELNTHNRVEIEIVKRAGFFVG